MKFTRRLLFATLLVAASLAPMGAASAQSVEPNWAASRGGGEQPRLLPLRDVLDMLRSRFGGEYVGHRLEGGGRPIYVVRWRMPDGVTIRDFVVDAQSGQLR